MEPHIIERAALLMQQKYGDQALPKAVAAAQHYAELNQFENVDNWVQIGYAIREIQDPAWAARRKQEEPAEA